MKKTLRTLLMGMMAIVAVALTSCSNDDELQTAPEGQKGYVEFSLSRGADTRTAYALNNANGLDATWSEGDQMVVVYGTGEDRIVEVFDLSSGAGTKTATFSNSNSDLADKSGNLMMIHFPSYDSNKSLTENVVDFSTQEGTLKDLGKYDYFSCEATLDEGMITPSDIKTDLAILRFPKDIDFGTGDGNMTKDFVFSGGRHEIVPDATITDAQKGDIIVKDVSLTNGKLNADLYVTVFGTMPPTTVTVAGKVYALPEIKDAGKIYTFKQSNLKTLEAYPLTLEAIDAGTITISNPNGLVMQYRVIGSSVGAILEQSSTTITIDVKKGERLQLFGDNKTYCVIGPKIKNTNIQCSSDCYIYGNIMSLIDSDGYETATTLTDKYTFMKLFEGNVHIKNTNKALILPATTLTESCYDSMFRGCSSLETAPELPATTLAAYCYDSMFRNCSSLETAPDLPAETLTRLCYEFMFSGCEKLKSTPKKLPATTLEESCYESMFHGCSSLETAPELPATTLAKSCYVCMFQYCDNLTTAPELPATTLAESCYFGMFFNCRSLKTAPEKLPATTLEESCYESMFHGCSSLTTAPELPAKTLVESCYNEMFYNCSVLNSVTCLATNISEDRYTSQWLDGVASNGTFTKAANMEEGYSWPVGDSGIPGGWTIKNYGE